MKSAQPKLTKEKCQMAIQQTAPDANAYVAEQSIDERPAQSTTKTPSDDVVLSGWDAAEKLTTAMGDFPVETRLIENEFQVFKFLDQEGPFAIYKQHFLNQKTSGKRSYVSLGANDPLCVKLNSKPENKRAFSVVNFSAEEGPQRQMLISGSRLYQALHAAHFSPQGPLTKGYWAISRTGKMAATVYTITPIKERDLEEDWKINPETAAAVVENTQPYTADAIRKPTWEELDEIANALL